MGLLSYNCVPITRCHSPSASHGQPQYPSFPSTACLSCSQALLPLLLTPTSWESLDHSPQTGSSDKYSESPAPQESSQTHRAVRALCALPSLTPILPEFLFRGHERCKGWHLRTAVLTWAVSRRFALFPAFPGARPRGIPTYRDFKADGLGAERRVHHSGFKEGSEEEEFLLFPQRILSKDSEISPRASRARTPP